MARRATDNTHEGNASGNTHPEDEIGAWQSQVKTRRVASVHDPALVFDEAANEAALFLPITRLPSWQPKDLAIQGAVRQVEVIGDPAGEGRLSTARATNDKNPVGTNQRPSGVGR